MHSYMIAVPSHYSNVVRGYPVFLMKYSVAQIAEHMDWAVFKIATKSSINLGRIEHTLTEQGVAYILTRETQGVLVVRDVEADINSKLHTEVTHLRTFEGIEFTYDGVLSHKKGSFESLDDTVKTTAQILYIRVAPKQLSKEDATQLAFTMALIEHLDNPTQQVDFGLIYKMKRLLAGD